MPEKATYKYIYKHRLMFFNVSSCPKGEMILNLSARSLLRGFMVKLLAIYDLSALKLTRQRILLKPYGNVNSVDQTISQKVDFNSDLLFGGNFSQGPQ